MSVKPTDVAISLIQIEPFNFAARWSFSAIPMFILMGCIEQRTRLASEFFYAVRFWLICVYGGLAVATTFSCAGFVDASGSSSAATATMGRIIIPEMLNAKYEKGLVPGVVARAGTLGNMVPPSSTFIIYAIFAEVSVTKLFMARILPGLLTVGAYTLVIMARYRFNPSLAPRIEFDVIWAMLLKL